MKEIISCKHPFCVSQLILIEYKIHLIWCIQMQALSIIQVKKQIQGKLELMN